MYADMKQVGPHYVSIRLVYQFSFSVCNFMVLIIDGNLEHVAHVWRNYSRFENAAVCNNCLKQIKLYSTRLQRSLSYQL